MMPVHSLSWINFALVVLWQVLGAPGEVAISKSGRNHINMGVKLHGFQGYVRKHIFENKKRIDHPVANSL